MPSAIKKEEDAPLTFAQKRAQNQALNKAILDEAALTASTLKIEKPKPKPKPKAKSSTPRRKTASVTTTPRSGTRSSSRLAGKDADDDTLKRKLEVEVEHENERQRQKRMRNNEVLSLGDIEVEGKKFGGIGGIKDIFKRGADPGVRTFTEDDVKETTDAGLKNLRERMGALELYEHWEPNQIKITPQRVYALGFHPTEDKPIVFAGDKEGAVGVFDGSQTAPIVEDDNDEDELAMDPVISAFKTHARTITSFVFPDNDHNIVLTSSYDSSVRKTDLQKEMTVQVWAPEDHDEEMALSGMDMAPEEPNVIYFSTLQGEVGKYDMRTPPGQADIWTLSDNKIGGFSLNPAQPHLLATASLDRTLKIWDLRKVTGKGDLRHPALMGEHTSRLSVSHASWSSAGHVATSSYDDTIKIYDFTDCTKWKAGHDIANMEPAHSVKHNNQTGRWVTILKPQWQKKPRDGVQKFTIGNMNRFVDVFGADGSQLAQLDGDTITAVPAVAHFHPTLDWVAGGNGSGKLCFWRAPELRD